jgi:hypothetical protein
MAGQGRDDFHSQWEAFVPIIEMSAAEETKARRAARRVGLRAVKSRRFKSTSDNCGGFQLINSNNWIIAGVRLELTADEVIECCNKIERGEGDAPLGDND